MLFMLEVVMDRLTIDVKQETLLSLMLIDNFVTCVGRWKKAWMWEHVQKRRNKEFSIIKIEYMYVNERYKCNSEAARSRCIEGV